MRFGAQLGLFFALAAACVLPVQAAPDVQEILRKFIEQSEEAEVADLRKAISYQRVSRVERLNEDGTRKREQVKIYKIYPENGESVTRLVSVNGRTPKEKPEAEKERSGAREAGERSRTMGISEDLLSRFDFTLLREETFAGRRTWVLGFQPKPDAKEEEFFDKLINAMGGTLWIDQDEYQMAKAEVRLGKKVSFFGGIAGAIEKLDLTLIQKRVEPSIWLAEATHIDFIGRKLFSAVRFRTFENCSEFKRVSMEHARAELPFSP